MQTISLVKEFHEVFNHPIADVPCIPPNETNLFRSSFIREELNELGESLAEENLIEFADALGDIQYVLDGWFLNAGLLHKKEAIMKAIHKSNMTKACDTVEQAEGTITSLSDVGTNCYYEKIVLEDKTYYVVKRTSDNKVMKPLHYKGPDIKTALGL